MRSMRTLKTYLTLSTLTVVAGLQALALRSVRVSPDQAADKWSSRLQSATQEITQGVNNVQTAPGQLAAAKFNKWLQGVQDAAQKWRRNVGNVSLESWRASMINIGIPRVGQGAQQKKGKYTAFASEFFPFLQRNMAQVHNMPDTTLEDRIARATQMMRLNSQFKRGGGSTPGV